MDGDTLGLDINLGLGKRVWNNFILLIGKVALDKRVCGTNANMTALKQGKYL